MKFVSDKDILLKLASKISYERKKRNLSQEKLAEMAGVNMRSVSMLENGTTNVKFLTLYNIAKAFDIEVCDLVNFHL